MIKPRSIERGAPENFSLATRSAKSVDIFNVQEGELAGLSLQRLVVGEDDSDAMRNFDSFVRDRVAGGYTDPRHHLLMQNALSIVRPVAWNEQIEAAWVRLSLEVSEAGFAAFSAKAKAVIEHIADNPGKFFTVFSMPDMSGERHDRAAHIDGFGMFSVQERYDHPDYVGFEPLTHIKGQLQYLPERAVMRGLFTKVS